MLVSKSWCEETAKDIIWEFENLLCNNDVKINNMNPEENEFESEDSYINKKDYENLKEKVTEQLIELVDYAEEQIEDIAVVAVRGAANVIAAVPDCVLLISNDWLPAVIVSLEGCLFKFQEKLEDGR